MFRIARYESGKVLGMLQSKRYKPTGVAAVWSVVVFVGGILIWMAYAAYQFINPIHMWSEKLAYEFKKTPRSGMWHIAGMCAIWIVRISGAFVFGLGVYAIYGLPIFFPLRCVVFLVVCYAGIRLTIRSL